MSPSWATARATTRYSLRFPSSPDVCQPLTSKRLLSQRARSLSPLPSISNCPSPTCFCAPTPSLEIDRTTSLHNTAPSYSQHIAIATGKSDWSSKIELEPGESNVAAHLKALLGRGRLLSRPGRFFDPERTVLVTNSSFTPPEAGMGVGVFLWPAFRYVEGFEPTKEGCAKMLERQLAPTEVVAGAADAGRNAGAGIVRGLTSTTVLICSHGERDQRCGIMGPLLKAEFERQMRGVSSEQPLEVLNSPHAASAGPHWSQRSSVSVGLVSHIGGHKWAGNVVVYVSPKQSVGGQLSALAGKGIWYGRVEPKHVEGIVKETIIGGKIIQELCRGIV